MALHVLNHLLPFQVLLFSLFQLPFLYNYMGRSSERECSVADRPSKNRACWSQNLHPYLPWAVGKGYVLIAQEKLFEDIRPKHFAEGSLPRLAPGWTVCNCSLCPVESYKPYVQGSLHSCWVIASVTAGVNEAVADTYLNSMGAF